VQVRKIPLFTDAGCLSTVAVVSKVTPSLMLNVPSACPKIGITLLFTIGQLYCTFLPLLLDLDYIISASEMTYIVSGGALNSTHSLISAISDDSFGANHVEVTSCYTRYKVGGWRGIYTATSL